MELKLVKWPAPDASSRKTAGMAMVEFVIILPILLMLVFAIVEFGVLFGRWQTVSNAAREGARTAVVFRTNCNAGSVETEVRQRVKDYASPLGIVVTDADIAISGVCGTSTSSSTVTVTVPYSFQVLPALAVSVTPTIDLVGNSVMRNEGNG
jgi:Flp pilus assembly protein TadG